MATKNRGLAWSVAETQLLIDLWSENNILNVLDGTTRNAAVYEKFSKQLEKRGFHRTTAQIRDRMKRLKRDYKEVIDSSKAGSGRKTCHFFYELDRILGNSSFANAVIDHDNSSPSIPLNVCQAELGKRITSDEEDEVQNAFTTHHHSSNDLVCINGPRRVSEEGAYRPVAKRRLKRGSRTFDIDAVGAENGLEAGEKVKLEVEKILLEMEKLREEIGRVREERGKLALEKEVLMLQRRRMLREENFEKLRMKQTELRKDEQLASFSQDMYASNIGNINAMEVDSERRTTNCSTGNNDSECINEVVDAWNDSSRSVGMVLTTQSCVSNSVNSSDEVMKSDGQECFRKLTGNISSYSNLDNEEQKKMFLNELNIVERLGENGGSSHDDASGLNNTHVQSLVSGRGYCGFLNHCKKCGHAVSCTATSQI